MKRIIPFILLTVIVLFYTKPFFRSGFFPTHDGEWAVVRLSEMYREVKDLQIPPRWADYLNHGFGYPLFSFTYPFPYYLGTIFKLIGFSYVGSVKIIFVLSVLFSSFFMFLLGRELSGGLGGFLAALFYTVAPFRLVDLYVRGSLGESLSLALFPLLFYVSIKYVQKPTAINCIVNSIVLAFLILTHNIMAIVFFPFWIAFFFTVVVSYYEDVKYYIWRYFLPMLFLGLGLSMYFFLPALLEKKFLALSVIKLANVNENFIRLKDYLVSSWSYEKPSYQLGWAHISAAVFSVIAVITANLVHRKKYFPQAIMTFISIAVLIFLSHPVSAVIWNLPPFSSIDFPWRLLTPLAFFLALASVFLHVHKVTRILGIILAVITVSLSLRFAVPSSYFEKPDSYYKTNDATTTSKDELMPLWVERKPTNRYSQKVEVEAGTAVVTDLTYNSKSVKFRAISEGASIVRVNSIYFPGWQFIADGEKVEIDYSNPEGIMKLAFGTGEYLVEGKFLETPIRKVSNYISFLSLSAVVVIVFRRLFLSVKHRKAG